MAKNLRFIQCGDLHLGSPFHNLAAIDDRWQRIIGKPRFGPFKKSYSWLLINKFTPF